MCPGTPVSLTPYNTLRLAASAAYYWRIDSLQALHSLPSHTRRFILGGGSNLVLIGDIDALVLHVALTGRALVAEDDEAWYIEAASGENWHDFVLWTLQQGWPGLENLALIPGTVGAAPIQNIGAYGLEVGDVIFRVSAYDPDARQTIHFSGSECGFAYRNSIFKRHGWHENGRYLITAVTFRLPKRWQARLDYADLKRELLRREILHLQALDIAAAVMAVRQQKLPDPDTLPNVGSFFENPIVDVDTAKRLTDRHPDLPTYAQADGSVKLAAGWLIEQAGWKGRRLGPVGMYEKQALVLVNHGGASARDVLRLVAAVQADIETRFAIRLKPEPVFVGHAPES